MGEVATTLDLRSLDLAPGAATRRRLRVAPVDLRLGGQDYAVEPRDLEVDLSVTRSLSGLHLDLRADVVLTGPCWRCMEDARVPLRVESSEFQADGRDPDAPFDEDLDSAYVDGDVLDLGLWVRDAVAEAVPPTVLCREDCAGLCPHCGANRNEVDCGCAPEDGDPRWDALRAVAERLASEGAGPR